LGGIAAPLRIGSAIGGSGRVAHPAIAAGSTPTTARREKVIEDMSKLAQEEDADRG
jgi:hypothetical protein